MNIKITDRNGVTLKTANTFVKEDIAVAVDLPQQEKSVTPTKSVQEVVADTGYDGLSKVTVNAIPDEYIVPSGNLNVTANGIYNVKTLETVTVAIPEWDGSSEDIVSGYTLNLIIESTELLDSDEWGYSLDNGSSYNQFTSGNMTLQNVTDIMFKAGYTLYRLLIGTTSGAQDIENLLGESAIVHTLTANTTWYLTRLYDAGGYD